MSTVGPMIKIQLSGEFLTARENRRLQDVAYRGEDGNNVPCYSWEGAGRSGVVTSKELTVYPSSASSSSSCPPPRPWRVSVAMFLQRNYDLEEEREMVRICKLKRGKLQTLWRRWWMWLFYSTLSLFVPFLFPFYCSIWYLGIITNNLKKMRLCDGRKRLW